MIQEIFVNLHTQTPMEPKVIVLKDSSAATGGIEPPATAPQTPPDTSNEYLKNHPDPKQILTIKIIKTSQGFSGRDNMRSDVNDIK